MPGEERTYGLPLFDAARSMGVPVKSEEPPADRWVHANGLRLHYLDWGGDGKPPLLLLHGAFQTAHSWDFVAMALRDRYRVLALDQRGHGDSDRARGADYSPEEMQRDLDEATAALGLGRLHLIGLSMGGRNGFVYAARHPEGVRSLVVVDAGPEAEERGVRNIARFVGERREATFEEFLERAMRFNPRRPEEQMRGSLLHNLRELPSGKWTWKYDHAFAEGFGRREAGRESLERHLGQVRSPTLLVRGAESDILSPGAAERTRAALADCRLVEVAGAGHLVPGDNPVDFIAEVERFLAEIDSR